MIEHSLHIRVRAETLTMDSREIAELTGKAHDKVVADIEAQLGAVGDVAAFRDIYYDSRNRRQAHYKLPYRETMILVSGYSVELRAAVIDRWLELERRSKIALVQLPDFSDPVAAARAWADEAEKRRTAERQVEEQAPKVAYADEISNTEGGIPLSDFAKVLAGKGWQIGRTRFFALLVESKMLFRKYLPALKQEVAQPYQEQIEAGRFLLHMVTIHKASTTNTTAIYPQTLITPKGQKYVIEHLIDWEVKRLVKNDSSKEKAS